MTDDGRTAYLHRADEDAGSGNVFSATHRWIAENDQNGVPAILVGKEGQRRGSA